MLNKSTLSFLAALAENNQKEWFDAHRKEYTKAKDDYATLVDNVIAKLAKTDESIAHLSAKECMFRINRDVRFSKNKDPYKTNFGASICKGGKKSPLAGYYIHCEPGGSSFIGGGIWMPESAVIKKVRQEIDYCFDEFKGIIEADSFKTTYRVLERSPDISLVKEPKGYEKDNPAIEYLKLKSWLATTYVKNEDWTSADIEEKIVATFVALKPLLDFLNRAIEE